MIEVEDVVPVPPGSVSGDDIKVEFSPGISPLPHLNTRNCSVKRAMERICIFWCAVWSVQWREYVYFGVRCAMERKCIFWCAVCSVQWRYYVYFGVQYSVFCVLCPVLISVQCSVFNVCQMVWN